MFTAITVLSINRLSNVCEASQTPLPRHSLGGCNWAEQTKLQQFYKTSDESIIRQICPSTNQTNHINAAMCALTVSNKPPLFREKKLEINFSHW